MSDWSVEVSGGEDQAYDSQADTRPAGRGRANNPRNRRRHQDADQTVLDGGDMTSSVISVDAGMTRAGMIMSTCNR